MNILVLNSILFTANDNSIPQVKSIKDTMIYNMCLGFIYAGHQVTLIAASEYEPTLPEEYEFKVLFFPSVLKQVFLPSVLPLQPRLWHYLRRENNSFDCIVTSEMFAFPSLFAAIICPRKTIVWQEMSLFQKKFFKIPAIMWHYVIVPLFMRKIKIVIPRSDQAGKFIGRFFKNVSQDIVDHGVNLKKFTFSEKKEKQFIIVAQLIKRKNIDYIIRQFYGFVQKYPQENYQLIIAGKGPEEEYLKALVKELHIEPVVHFTGFLNHCELNKQISQSIATLIATTKDLNMVSIPESIVSGTPVVTNLVPTSSTYIAVNQLGIAKNKWDASDLKIIVDNNDFYVANCIKYREKLTNVFLAKKLINIATKGL